MGSSRTMGAPWPPMVKSAPKIRAWDGTKQKARGNNHSSQAGPEMTSDAANT